nr:hypothetical protein [Tanacetum cinerariifolium]
HAQPEDSNELFQKLLEDLKELAEYVNSPSKDRPIFFDDNEDHSVQNKEYLEILLMKLLPRIPIKRMKNHHKTLTFIVSVEKENAVYHKEEEVDLEDISQIQDVILHEKLLSINHLIANIKSLNDNPTPDHVLNSSVSIPIFEETNNSLSDNFHPNSKLFAIIRKRREVERLINVVKNDISNDSSNDPLLEEADLFLASDNSIPPGIENFGDDSEGDIRFLEALLIDDSIPFLVNESSESDFDNPSFPRPPPEPPDADFEPDSGDEIPVVMNTIDELECLTQEMSLMFLMMKMMIIFLSCLSSEFFFHILSILRHFLFFSPLRVRTPSLTL